MTVMVLLMVVLWIVFHKLSFILQVEGWGTLLA